MKKRAKFSMQFKATILIAVLSLVLVGITMTYFSFFLSNNNQSSYKQAATKLSNTVSNVIDVDKFKSLKDEVKTIVDSTENKVTSDEWGSKSWNEYSSKFDVIANSDLYKEVKDLLKTLNDVNLNMKSSIYLAYVDKDLKLLVIVVDSGDGKIECPPGCLDPIESENEKVLEDPKNGFPVHISNSKTYGWNVVSGTPIYSGEEVVGYGLVSISMYSVREAQRDSILRLFIYLIVLVVILTSLGFIAVHFVFVKPLKKLTNTANNYNSDDPEKTHKAFEELNIKSHDEIYDLSRSIKKMEKDIYEKINELAKMNHEVKLSQKQANEMRLLANKDALTGVRNKTAYLNHAKNIDEEIKKGHNPQFGIAMIDLNRLKKINDDYGHSQGDASIIKIANIICAIFAHSPVFRVGGDEFVATLRNSDFRRSEELLKEFNEKTDLLKFDDDLTEPEKVSAAIGYAVYDKNIDTCVNDVFKRADELMYSKKRRM